MEYPPPATVLPLSRLTFNSCARQGQIFSFLGQYGGFAPHDSKCKILEYNVEALATLKLCTNRLLAPGIWVVAMMIVLLSN
jgi:hypothetical protein